METRRPPRIRGTHTSLGEVEDVLPGAWLWMTAIAVLHLDHLQQLAARVADGIVNLRRHLSRRRQPRSTRAHWPPAGAARAGRVVCESRATGRPARPRCALLLATRFYQTCVFYTNFTAPFARNGQRRTGVTHVPDIRPLAEQHECRCRVRPTPRAPAAETAPPWCPDTAARLAHRTSPAFLSGL